ncbi:MAG TPA: alpha/beta hydrolase [Candidatus Saccharimonadales bacterium]|nr:alpha/beta hydrolase [Candidatus Saccharimonadales bacterium]
MAKTAKNAAKYILPLYMNGLSGRMIKMPPPRGKRREILLISGQHTSIERIYGLAEYLNRFGGVTSPDLPGLGGMTSFYKIGEKPTLDNMADYLATFIKLRYKKNRRFTLIAVSYGFAVATRMLQRYPELASRVDLLISLSGVTHKADFKWKKHNYYLLYGASWLFSRRVPAYVAKTTCIRAPVIRGLYRIAEAKHPKLKDAKQAERAKRINFEIKLWKANDFRTWTYSCVSLFRLDLTKRHADLPVYHVSVDDDHYFSQVQVESHMRRIFKDFELVPTKLPAHAPTVLATPKDVEPFIPPKIRVLLRRQPRK